MAHEIAPFSCCRSPLPDLPPTHPSSCGSFFLLVSFFFHFMFVVKLLICGWFKLQQFSNYERYECTFSKLFFHWCSLWVGCRFFLFFPLSSLLYWFNCILMVRLGTAWFGLAWLPVVCEKWDFKISNCNQYLFRFVRSFSTLGCNQISLHWACLYCQVTQGFDCFQVSLYKLFLLSQLCLVTG